VIIAVDIGNSALKAALVDGDRVIGSGRLETAAASTADLAGGLQTLSGHAAEPPQRIVGVSVVDRWTERLERAADELSLPLTVVSASHIPIGTALPRPDRVGPDRLLAAWAAVELYGSPVIVVDLGTATSVDVVDADGIFLGGAILPGMGLAADALAEDTARLPRVELELPSDAVGTDTTSALQSGIVIGHVGAVREIAARMQERLAAEGAGAAAVVITGGHAAAPWARAAWLEPAGPAFPAIGSVLDPDLVLRGLGLLAQHLAIRPGATVGR
jgi:type III pantothenate kinase